MRSAFCGALFELFEKKMQHFSILKCLIIRKEQREADRVYKTGIL
jgi:hypothetical protein